LHFFRIAPGLVAVLAATSLQDSELPYRIISASRTLGGASARILSASIAASTAEICESDEEASDATEESMKTNGARCLRRPPDLQLAEAREDCPHLFVILRRMVDKVGDSLFYRFFHDLGSESLVAEHIGSGALRVRPLSFYGGAHRQHDLRRARRVLHNPAAV
jgi:hypothetical protein